MRTHTERAVECRRQSEAARRCHSVANHTASLRNSALGLILEALAEIVLVAIIHCDIDRVREGKHSIHFDDLVELFAAHAGASVIWPHTGPDRFVVPGKNGVFRLTVI